MGSSWVSGLVRGLELPVSYEESEQFPPHDNGEDVDRLETFYGLPTEVRFCNRCVISNQRPNSAVEFRHTPASTKHSIALDYDGVCDACRVAEAKSGIDWVSRDQELRELAARYKRDDGRYDCIVPGSGGKDSFYAAHKLKYEYGLNPLTVTWAPHIYTDWGFRNHTAWIHAGFDNVLVTPNGRVHRLLTRLAVDRLLHPFQPFILGQKNLAPKMALLYDVPLVFYGEHEADYGNPRAEFDNARRNWEYFTSASDKDIFLGGTSLQELRDEWGLRPGDWDSYLPADPAQLERKDVQVHYLGYYLPWHPQGAYYYTAEHGDFTISPERTPGTYSKYNSIDDKIDDFHYHTTFIKFGIGRATYDASQEVRSGELTRDEAVALVHKYDGEFPTRFERDIYRYLSLGQHEYPAAASNLASLEFDRDYYDDLCDRFRSPHLWRRESTSWSLRHMVQSTDPMQATTAATNWVGNTKS